MLHVKKKQKMKKPQPKHITRSLHICILNLLTFMVGLLFRNQYELALQYG